MDTSSFPEHRHIWTVVEIRNNPVGVTCKMCDVDYHVVDVPPRRADGMSKDLPALQLIVGARYRVNGMIPGENVEAVIEDVTARQDNRRASLDVTFRLRPIF